MGGFRHWRESMAKSADDLENDRLKAVIGLIAAETICHTEALTPAS